MIKYLFIISISVLICAENSYSYIDMGSGSYMLQILLAGILGGIYAFKGWIIKTARVLLHFIKKRKSGE
jgi:hypothetical protein